MRNEAAESGVERACNDCKWRRLCDRRGFAWWPSSPDPGGSGHKPFRCYSAKSGNSDSSRALKITVVYTACTHFRPAARAARARTHARTRTHVRAARTGWTSLRFGGAVCRLYQACSLQLLQPVVFLCEARREGNLTMAFVLFGVALKNAEHVHDLSLSQSLSLSFPPTHSSVA